MIKIAPRTITEIGFIVFLLYSNLLTGEFTRSAGGQGKTLEWAIKGIFTMENLVIAVVASVIGYVAVETLRNNLWDGGDVN
jgi:hypothetical protein